MQRDKPAENTEYKIEYEERPKNDETDKIDPRPPASQWIIDLQYYEHNYREASFIHDL